MADTAIDVRRRTLEEAAVEVCAYCHGVKGHGPVPVKTPEGYVHLFTRGNGSNPCASGKIWAIAEQTKQDRELFRSPKREQLQPVAPSSEPSIPALLREMYRGCQRFARHEEDYYYVSARDGLALIERIGRAEDRIAELEIRCQRINFTYEVPKQFRDNRTGTAYSSGYEAGWRDWAGDNPYAYSQERYFEAYEAGWSAAQKSVKKKAVRAALAAPSGVKP